MKKLLLTMLCAVMSLAGMAQTANFDGKLVITINEITSEPQDATILFDYNEADMTCNFTLNNFCLADGENVIPVGNIKVQNLPLSPVDEENFAFSFDGNILIEEGNMEGLTAEDYIGPILGEIPLKLTGTVSAKKMVVHIDIDMVESLGQIVAVDFASSDLIDLSNAATFVDNLVITINGESTDAQEAMVYLVMNEDGTCVFVLKNFCLDGGDGNIMPVGNIVVPGLIPNFSADGANATMSYDGNLVITAGDLEGIDEWVGPMLGEIPLKISAKSNMEKIYVTIDIDMMESLGQIIYVTFGSDYEAVVDAINKLTSEQKGQTYDLQGRRVQHPLQGLYIQNGKKVMR